MKIIVTKEGEKIRMEKRSFNSRIGKGHNLIMNSKNEMKGITLIALVITILFSYDEMIKFSNSRGFLLATI